jgi:hypothetical protein
MDYGTPRGTKINWTPQVKLEGSTYLIEEWNGSKCPNVDVVNDDDDNDDLDEIKCLKC